jgi:hypothetical protein
MLVIEVMAAKTIAAPKPLFRSSELTAIAARFKRRDGNATVKYQASLSVFLGVFNSLWITSVYNFMAYRPSRYP